MRKQHTAAERCGRRRNLPVPSLYRYVSPSRLNLWLACPLAFKFKYVDGLFPPPSPALFLGGRVHAALGLYYSHRRIRTTLDCAEVVDYVTATWEEAAEKDRVVFESLEQEEELKRQAADLIRAYLAAVPQDEPPPLAVGKTWSVGLVDPTNGEDLGMNLLGIIDLVLDGPKGPIIIDFKATTRSGRPLEVAHEIQLNSYSYLFRTSTGRQEAAIEIRSLVRRQSPVVETHRFPPRTDLHFRRLFAAVRAYRADLQTGRFVFRPGFGCNICDFRATHCAGWDGEDAS